MEQMLQVLTSNYVTYPLMFLACVCLSMSIIVRAEKHKVLGRTAKTVTATWKKFLHYASEATEKRIREEERLQREEGNREKKHFLYRLDEMLLQTGLKKRVPFLTVEATILVLAISFLLVLIFVTEMTGSVLIGGMASGIFLMVLKESAQVVVRYRQRKVEENIIQFANLIENYAKTSDDIVKILHKIFIYLEEPLKSAVESCYIEAYTTGDFSTACAHLDANIGNRYLSNMLTNIESCSRHQANYEEVIHGNKEIIRKYLSEREMQREICRNARMEILLLLFMVGVVVFSFKDALPGGFQIFSSGMTGKIIIGILGVVLLVSIRVMISIGAEEG